MPHFRYLSSFLVCLQSFQGTFHPPSCYHLLLLLLTLELLTARYIPPYTLCCLIYRTVRLGETNSVTAHSAHRLHRPPPTNPISGRSTTLPCTAGCRMPSHRTVRYVPPSTLSTKLTLSSTGILRKHRSGAITYMRLASRAVMELT